jgi:hypothetical protein
MLQENALPHHEKMQEVTQNDAISEQALTDTNRKASNSATVRALLLKSVTLQSRNWCSNLCQAVSPVLCLLFTLAVRQIVGGITTGAVWSM